MNYFCKSMLILSFEVQSKNGGKHIYLVTVHFLQEEHGCQDDLQKYQVVSQHDEAGITYQSVCSIFLKDRHNIKAIISTIWGRVSHFWSFKGHLVIHGSPIFWQKEESHIHLQSWYVGGHHYFFTMQDVQSFTLISENSESARRLDWYSEH